MFIEFVIQHLHKFWYSTFPQNHIENEQKYNTLILTLRAFSDNPIFLSSVQSVSPLLIHDNDFWHNYLALARDHLAR